jgi:uncharacterized membrane protein required for colicin V production
MAMVFWAFFIIVVFASLAMMVREGLWTNTITLVTIIVAGLVAFGFYSPIVVYFDEGMTDGQHTYWLDYAVLWALFAATIIVLRAVTAAASRTRMRFKHPIDPVGGPLVGFIAALVLASFTVATLHVSPMGKDAFSGGLVKPEDVESASAISSPDAAWLRFVEHMAGQNAFGSPGTQNFEAEHWVKFYSDRRAALEKSTDFIVDRTKS